MRSLFVIKILLKTAILIVSILFVSNLQAQEAVKNFEVQYNNTKSNTPERFSMAGKYAQTLFYDGQVKKAFEILNQNVAFAVKYEDGKYATYLYAVIAINHQLEKNIQLRDNNIFKANYYSKKTQDYSAKGFVKYAQGWIKIRNFEETEAIKNFLEALKYYDMASSNEVLLSRLAAVYSELTDIYGRKNEYELQEKYSKLGLEVALKQNDKNTILTAYMSIGYMYEQQFFKNSDNKVLRDLAEKYYLNAIDLYRANEKEILAPSNLAFIANNLAYLYLTYYPESFQTKGIKYAELAKEIGIKTGQRDVVAAVNGMLSEIALERGDTENAKAYLLASLKEVELYSTNQNIVWSIYESLSEIYEQEGNYAEALRYYKLYMTTYKSSYDQEQVQISKKLEAEFDKERQQQKMIRLQLETEKKEQQIKLMHSLGIQQKQEIDNAKLREDFQLKKLALSQLESEKQTQELTISNQHLRLSKLENNNRKEELVRYIQELNFKDKLNKYYIASIAFAIALLALLLYALKQRNKHLKQREEVHYLEIDKERQNTKISTLTALLEGQEQERARLARDLHDGLGGLLSGTKIQLTHLNEKINLTAKTDLTKTIDQLDGAVDELRRVAHNLMPDLLVKYGLEEALKEYAVRMSNEYLDINVQFLSFTATLDKENQLLVYRIIQELVNNAIKHANASEIIIQFVEDEHEYTVTVEDDGKGFNVENTKQTQSAGLHNIQSRVQFLKGQLHIHSEINLGTSIEFHFPKLEL